MILAIIVAIVATIIIVTMHNLHKGDVTFIKAEARKYISEVATTSYRQGWMHGNADERQTQRDAVDAVINSAVTV